MKPGPADPSRQKSASAPPLRTARSTPIAVKGTRWGHDSAQATRVRTRLNYIEVFAPQLAADVAAESALVKQRPGIKLAEEAAFVRKQEEQKEAELEAQAERAAREEARPSSLSSSEDEEGLLVTQQMKGLEISEEPAREVVVLPRRAPFAPQYEETISRSAPAATTSHMQVLRNQRPK